MQKINLDHYLIPYININSKWTMDLNIKVNTIKVPEENNGEITHGFGSGKDLLDRAQKA